MSEVDQFLRLCEAQTFRHKERLISGLKSGECLLRTSPTFHKNRLPCSHYFAIYQRRAKLLEKCTTDHGRNLRADALALCDALANSPDEPVMIWSFTQAPYFDYSVFEGATSHHILGCVFGVDDRLIDAKTRKELWGETETP